MFFFKDYCLYQSRIYPSETQALIDQNREIVHKIMATCLGVPNLWVLKTKRPDINCCESAYNSSHYPDYNSYGNLSFIKGTEVIPKMTIGRQPLCVGCGKPFNSHYALKCRCTDTVVCHDCGRTVLTNNARYEDGAYYCHACLHICASCGRVCKEDMFPAFDRKGRLMEVCRECFERSQEPCFACSVRNVCAIIGNSLCQHAAISPAHMEVP